MAKHRDGRQPQESSAGEPCPPPAVEDLQNNSEARCTWHHRAVRSDRDGRPIGQMDGNQLPPSVSNWAVRLLGESPQPVLVTDQHLNVIYWNLAAEQSGVFSRQSSEVSLWEQQLEQLAEQVKEADFGTGVASLSMASGETQQRAPSVSVVVVPAEDALGLPGYGILISRESPVRGESLDYTESATPEAASIKRATELAGEANSTAEFLAALLALDGALVKADTITVLRLSDDSSVLRPVVAAGWAIDAYWSQAFSVTGELRYCLDKGWGLVIGGEEDLRASGLHEALHSAASSVAIVPLRVRGSTWGVIALTKQDSWEETSRDRVVCQTISNLVAVVIERELALHDLQEAERNNRLAALGQLASSVSHELRNLLSAIDVTAAAASSAIIAATKPTSGDPPVVDLVELSRLLDRIRSELSSGHLVVDDILEFGKDAPLNLVPTLLGAWVRTQQAFFQSVIGNSANIVITIKTDAEVLADRRKLRQAIANLIKNAADASNPGDDITIAVDVGPDPSNRKNPGSLLTVTDHGSGIPASIAPHVFDQFVTTKVGGTGLGLIQVYTIITRHGGRVAIESVPEDHTTVLIWIPFAPPRWLRTRKEVTPPRRH